jgi:hypothetical protein
MFYAFVADFVIVSSNKFCLFFTLFRFQVKFKGIKIFVRAREYDTVLFKKYKRVVKKQHMQSLTSKLAIYLVI